VPDRSPDRESGPDEAATEGTIPTDGGASPDPPRGGSFDHPAGAPAGGADQASDGSAAPEGGRDVTVLGHLGIDLTEIAESLSVTLDGELWADELRAVKEIFERREGHAAILVGPNGVGKRALVLTLARHIAEGKVPPRLAGKRVIELPFQRVVASAREPGDFEKIVFAALREAIERDDVVLFLDGITGFMGVGPGGSHAALLDATQVIEMGCHQPRLYLLCSTTPELHREVVRSMPWCEDAFSRVEVTEPDRVVSVEILREAARGLGEFHGVEIGQDSIEASIDLSDEYVRERVLPGKALELLDRAASKVATARGSGEGVVSVSPGDVAQALADWIDIPVSKLNGPGHSELADLEARLGVRIKGQDACIRKLADVIRVTKLNLNARPTRPDGVFLFVGPSGVGKSELTVALAEELYGSESRRLEFNMARYASEDGVARLVGATFADVEYKGELTTAVGRSPHSVVVFEHIERSHIDVAILLTQIFRDGYVVNGQGNRVYLSNCTIIMTSNSENLVPTRDDEGTVGFGQVAQRRRERYVQLAKNAIEDFFPPEFMDGIDEVLLFDPLTDDALKEIVQVHLADIAERLKRRSISLEVTEEAVAKMVEKGASREYGARNLGRTVEGLLLKPLARFLVANPDARGVVARVVEGDVEVVGVNGGA
jgi:ATP-dependent Clp protease ATP-binding subunit ClpA